MNRTSWRMAGLALVLALTLARGIEAQQRQQHHRGGTQASEEQPGDTSPGAPGQGQMMGQMQGMMKNMQGMMKHMQTMMGMMGRGGMMGMMSRGGMQGMMGRGGMMADADDGEEMPWGGMMGRDHKKGHKGMFLRHLERMTQQLDLTDEQETQVRSLVRAHMKDAIRVKADIAIQMIDVRDLLDAASVDLPKVKELLQTIASQKADLHFAHIALRQEISRLLTPEQQKKFRTMRRRMMRGHGGMMGYGSMMQRGGMRGRVTGSK